MKQSIPIKTNEQLSNYTYFFSNPAFRTGPFPHVALSGRNHGSHNQTCVLPGAGRGWPLRTKKCWNFMEPHHCWQIINNNLYIYIHISISIIYKILMSGEEKKNTFLFGGDFPTHHVMSRPGKVSWLLVSWLGRADVPSVRTWAGHGASLGVLGDSPLENRKLRIWLVTLW